MRKRPFSRAYVWARSGALVPALCVALTSSLVIVVMVLPAISALTPGPSPTRAGTVSDVRAGIPSLFAAALTAYIAALLASFTIVRRGIDGMIADKLLILARVEQVQAGVPLPDDQKAETIARLRRRGWVSPEDARAVANGQADERVMAYLLDNLAPQSRVTQWAVARVMEVYSPTQGRPGRRSWLRSWLRSRRRSWRRSWRRSPAPKGSAAPSSRRLRSAGRPVRRSGAGVR
jgi:hypothetical protein